MQLDRWLEAAGEALTFSCTGYSRDRDPDGLFGIDDTDREQHVRTDRSAVDLDGPPSRSNSLSIQLAMQRDDHHGRRWATSAVMMAEQSAAGDQHRLPLTYSDVRFDFESD
ncbi:hypothetical protein MAP00_002825 [Monascus purpureus]|nr:hypothetical protein MAP00_002825 [Monascus purpureus]